METMESYSRVGIILKDEKIGLDSVHFEEPDRTKLFAIGAPLEIEVARKFIKRYWAQMKESKIKNDHFAFTFGKEAIMSILAQEGCEGIRFYLADKPKWEEKEVIDVNKKPQNYYEGLTLVALGVKRGEEKGNDQPEIGFDNGYIIDEDSKPPQETSHACDTAVPIPGKRLSEIFNKYWEK